MKVLVILLVTSIAMVHSASYATNTQCSICKTTIDWVRSNENVLGAMKLDEQVDQNFISVIESGLSSESVCGLLTLCESTDEAQDYLTNLRGGGHGGHGHHSSHHSSHHNSHHSSHHKNNNKNKKKNKHNEVNANLPNIDLCPITKNC